MNKEYRIYQPRLEGLNFQIAKLNKRAAKLGCAPILVRDTGRFEDVPVYNENDISPRRPIGFRRFVFIEVSGESPKFEGWSLAAVVEHAEEGNILRKSPECKIELNQFRSGAPRCDHCKALRNRKDTFIVSHDNGSVKMVGSNCLRDFLGHVSPHQFAAMAEIMFSLGELCSDAEGEYGPAGYHQDLIAVDTLLAYAACAIRIKGFISSKAARESQENGGNITSTKDTAAAWMNPFKGATRDKDYFVPEESDQQAAEKSKQHVLDTLGSKDAETLSDFEHNLLTVCKCEAVEKRNLGILAFVPEYYARSIADAKQAATEAYFGEVGKRVRGVALTYVKSTGWESQFGYSYMHSFVGPKGERMLWKSSNNVDCTAGAVLSTTFTVKAHEDYKGHKQTKISRLVVA